MKNKPFSTLLIGLFLSTVAIAQDTAWVRDNTWYFDNFSQPEVGWEVFRETFIGVAPEKVHASDFDRVLYEAIYKNKLFETGHCFGMDLMAMMMLKNGGHLGYCHPPYIYAAESPAPVDTTKGPSDLTLRRAIQIMEGYQITHRFVVFLLDVYAKKQHRNGIYAYQQYSYYTAMDDPCVISITKGSTPGDEGHVLVPFFAKDSSDHSIRLYVYDPNRSYYELGPEGHDYYHKGQNFIKILANGDWSFKKDETSSGIWKGDKGSGGHCIVIPISVAGKKDRLPQSIFADAADAIGKIFIFGQDAALEQISVPDGRRYFQPGTNELEISDSAALRCVLPFIPMNGGKSVENDDCQLYFVRGENDLNMDIHGDECGYKVVLFSDYTSITVTSEDPYATERISVRGWHTPNPSVEVAGNCGVTTGLVEIKSLLELGQ